MDILHKMIIPRVPSSGIPGGVGHRGAKHKIQNDQHSLSYWNIKQWILNNVIGVEIKIQKDLNGRTYILPISNKTRDPRLYQRKKIIN